MHLPIRFGKPSSRRATRQHRQRRLVVEGLEAREMLNVDPGSITDIVPLGVVDFIQVPDLAPAAGEIWYSAEAGLNGLFSLEAAIVGNPSDATLTLYDSDGQELKISAESGQTQRLDWEANLGDSFLVQISGSSNDVDLTLANLVEQIGATVTVADTADDDHFDFSSTPTGHRITINDLAYDFLGSNITNIVFSAGVGHDTAALHDSAGDDTFEAGPASAKLSSDTYSVTVNGAKEVQAYAREGGVDTAKLYDSAGDDTFVSAASFGKLYGEDFFIRAKSFEYLHGYAKAGGNDRAKMFDSPDRDTFVATPTYAKMLRGVGDAREFSARSKFFETVKAYATEGNRDLADLHGSDGDDTLIARRYQTDFSGQDSEGQGFSVSIHDFFVTRAYDDSSGSDVARLYDSQYKDTFDAEPKFGRLYKAEGEEEERKLKFSLQARGFDEVHAYSRSEGDVANIQDSPGDDSSIGKAEDEICKLSGTGFFIRAKAFDRVYAKSTEGGNDSAELTDSVADDLLEGYVIDNVDLARISGSHGEIQYSYEVTGFDPVKAISSNGGIDIAVVDPGATFLNVVGDWF